MVTFGTGGNLPEVQLPCLKTQHLPAHGGPASNPGKLGSGSGPQVIPLACVLAPRKGRESCPAEPDAFLVLSRWAQLSHFHRPCPVGASCLLLSSRTFPQCCLLEGLLIVPEPALPGYLAE